MTWTFYRYALLLACLSGCSWLVSPAEGPIKCKVETGSRDRCPGNLVCVENECRSIVCKDDELCGDRIDNDCDGNVDEFDRSVGEKCDHEDNDCDGNTDEGFPETESMCDLQDDDCDGDADEDFDVDDDESTTCGKNLNYKPGDYDCEPTISAVHPGAQEICDGLDNDCDGNTDNEPTGKSSCGLTQICDKGRCVTPSCANAPPGSSLACAANETCVDDVCVKPNCPVACSEGQYCDPVTKTCMAVQRKNGDSCNQDSDCLSKTCIDSAALLLSTTSRRVCGKACCADTDCASDESCFASGTGARSCLPRKLAENKQATKTCTVSADCPAPQVCAAGESTQAPGTRKLATSVCRTPQPLLLPPERERSFAEQCLYSGPNSCNTRLCLPLIVSSVCSTPCQTSANCAKLKDYNAAINASYCQYVELSTYSSVPLEKNYAPICVVTFDQVPTRTPASCLANRDCPDQTCIGASTQPVKPGKCASTCCTDLQCEQMGGTGGAIVRPNARCLPVARGTGRFEMRCIE